MCASKTSAPVLESVTRLFGRDPVLHRYQRQIDKRARLVTDILTDLTPSSILDLGAGDGRISLPFACATTALTLVDISERMIALARNNMLRGQEQYVNFVLQDVMTISESTHFDVILCLGVLAHVADPQACIEKMARLLAPGGVVIVQLTDTDTMLGRMEYFLTGWGRTHRGYKFNRLSSDMITRSFRDLGLNLVQETRYLSFPEIVIAEDRKSAALAKAILKVIEHLGGERLLAYRMQ
jgi:ubiquinone/menaquinone biosynthesis C-methylase UbiE